MLHLYNRSRKTVKRKNLIFSNTEHEFNIVQFPVVIERFSFSIGIKNVPYVVQRTKSNVPYVVFLKYQINPPFSIPKTYRIFVL